MVNPPPHPGNAAGTGGGDAVAALAREVEALQRRLHTLEDVPARVDDLANVVAGVADLTAADRRRSSSGGGNGSEGEAEPTVLSWLAFTGDTAAAEAVLADLIDWMGRVYLRYSTAARALPDCWMWHPHVVEELLWLKQAWQTAYETPGAMPAYAGDWHGRHLPGVVERIKEATSTCSIDAHQPRPGQPPRGAAPVVPLSEAAGDIAGWWVQQPGQPPPEPTHTQLDAAASHAQTLRGVA